MSRISVRKAAFCITIVFLYSTFTVKYEIVFIYFAIGKEKGEKSA